MILEKAQGCGKEWAHHGKQYRGSLKNKKRELPYLLHICTSGYVSYVPCSVIHTNQGVETTSMTIDRGMRTENVT